MAGVVVVPSNGSRSLYVGGANKISVWVGQGSVVGGSPKTKIIHQPDGSYRVTLGGVQLDYRTTLNAQNEQQMTMAFPPGTLQRVDVEGQDLAGTALELGGIAVNQNASALTLNQFFGNALVVKALWKLTYSDGSVTNYLVPLTR